MTSMRELINLLESKQDHTEILDESSVSRLVSHIRKGVPFMMLSAMRADVSYPANMKRTDALKKALTKLPVAFIVTGGEFHEIGQEEPSEEISFFVMPKKNLDYEQFFNLGRKLMGIFDQDAVILGDGQNVNMVERDGTTFSIGSAASFRPDVVRSAPGHSKIKNRKFTFTNTDDTKSAVPYGGQSKVA